MIEHDFYRFGGSESVGSSDTRLEFVVQALDGTERDFIARLEPVQDKRLVRADHAGDFLHWLEARSHRLLTPLVHEFFRPRLAKVNHGVGAFDLHRFLAAGTTTHQNNK